MKKLLAIAMFLALVSAAWAQARKTRDRWWDRRWDCRRTVEVQAPKPKYPGDEVGYVEFRTGGRIEADGRDLRVVAQDKPVAHKIIQLGPGDVCKVAFRLVPGVTTYGIYYGNPKAKPSEGGWEAKRGLLLEVRRYRGPGYQTWAQTKQSLDRAKSLVMGRMFAPNVFLGYNPFGETKNYISVYTGWLAIDAPGNYAFATTSDDASFLFIDDKPVAEWPGTHRALPYAARVGVVKGMTAGLHRFAYYHVQAIDRAAAVAAWIPPSRLKDLPPPSPGRDGGKARMAWMKKNKFDVIPAGAFPPVARGVLKAYDVRGSKPVADFDVKNLGEIAVGDGYAQRIQFIDKTPQRKRPSPPRWRFGDGNGGTGSPVEHVYFEEGDYKVTLEVGRASITQTVHVDRDWSRQMRPSKDGPEQYFPIISKYAFASMPPAHLVAAARYFEELGKDALTARLCCQVLSAKGETIPPDTRYELTMLLAETAHDAESARAAVAACHSAEQKTQDMRQQAALALAAGEVSLEQLDSPDLAEKEFRRVATQYASASRDTMRRAYVGLGDAYRAKGNCAKAKECYDQAAEIPISKDEFRRSAVQVGAYSRAVDMYLRDGKLDHAEDFLDAWEWEFPAERLHGYSTLLRARVLVARGDHRNAARSLDRLVLVNPTSPYAADCLMLAAQCYVKVGDKKKAAAVLRQVVDEYKDSPLNAEAAKQLKQMGG